MDTLSIQEAIKVIDPVEVHGKCSETIFDLCTLRISFAHSDDNCCIIDILKLL